jgi:hypothetical protein
MVKILKVISSALILLFVGCGGHHSSPPNQQPPVPTETPTATPTATPTPTPIPAGISGTFSPVDPFQIPVILGTSYKSDTPVPGWQTFLVTVLDSGVPKAGSNVVLDFTNSAGIRLWAHGNAGNVVDCVAKTVSQATDVNGVANFVLNFGGFENIALIDIYADGVNIGRAKARSSDLDGHGGTGANDLSVWLQTPPTEDFTEGDLNVNGLRDQGDFDLFMAAYAASNGLPTDYCP